MKLVEESRDGVTVLTLRGEFDSFVTSSFTGEIAKLQAEGANRIVLNQRLVKFINSTALGSIIKARKTCREAGGDLVISSPSPAVREAMESLGLDRVFRIFETDEAAVSAIAGTADPAGPGASA